MDRSEFVSAIFSQIHTHSSIFCTNQNKKFARIQWYHKIVLSASTKIYSWRQKCTDLFSPEDAIPQIGPEKCRMMTENRLVSDWPTTFSYKTVPGDVCETWQRRLHVAENRKCKRSIARIVGLSSFILIHFQMVSFWYWTILVVLVDASCLCLCL